MSENVLVKKWGEMGAILLKTYGYLGGEAVPIRVVDYVPDVPDRGGDHEGSVHPTIEAALCSERAHQIRQVVSESVAYKGPQSRLDDEVWREPPGQLDPGRNMLHDDHVRAIRQDAKAHGCR